MLLKIKKKKKIILELKVRGTIILSIKLFADDQLTVKSNEGKLSDTRFRDALFIMPKTLESTNS